jgi:two-component system response regulator LytT
MKAVIVEDEVFAQEFLRTLLKEKYPNIEVVKVLDSVKDSIEFFSNNSVDIIFMDINLKDGYCFKIFDEVFVSTPIIFTTAYDEFAIKAFELNSISYILKPLDEDKLSLAINKFLTLNPFAYYSNINSLLTSFNNKPTFKQRFSIKFNDKIIVILQDEVAYFVAENRTCFLVTKDNRKFVVDFSLDYIYPCLDPIAFFRISRDCIASISSISSIRKYFKGRLSVTLSPIYSNDFIVSRDRVEEFLKWIDK